MGSSSRQLHFSIQLQYLLHEAIYMCAVLMKNYIKIGGAALYRFHNLIAKVVIIHSRTCKQCMLFRQHTIVNWKIDVPNIQFRNLESKLFSFIRENCRERFEAKSWRSQI